MKPYILALLVLLPFAGFAQKIEKYYDYLWHETEPKYARFYSITQKTDSGWHSTDYYLHNLTLQMEGLYEDSARKISSGRFIYVYPNKKLETYGRYQHGKKQGLWLTFYPEGGVSDSVVYDQGNPVGTRIGWHHNGYISDSSVYQPGGSGMEIHWFDNGNPSSAGYLSAGFKKQGKWKYYHKNGQLSALETYNEGKLVDKQYFDETGSAMADTSNKDRQASFPGGLTAWANYLGKHLYFPDQVQIVNSDKAVVVVSATIGEDGKIENAYVRTPFYPEFDKIALDADAIHPPGFQP
ncbi:MAG TPA: hypothetical protein VGM41_00850 [Chitinophagaceae bacterium]|jgi:antitoxin component YwqK of YwqJK toxin-antitoxin module